MLSLDTLFRPSRFAEQMAEQVKRLLDRPLPDPDEQAVLVPRLSETMEARTASVATLETPPNSLSPRKKKTTRKATRRPIIQVEPDSLYDILHRHAGVSLFVRPICWTDLHSKLLNVRWTQLPACDYPRPGSPGDGFPALPRGIRKLSKAGDTLMTELTHLFVPGEYDTVQPLQEILGTLYPPRFGFNRGQTRNPNLHVWVGNRAYKESVHPLNVWYYPITDGADSFNSVATRPAGSSESISCESLLGEGDPDPAPAEKPILAYISREQLKWTRANLYRVVLPPSGRPNKPIALLQAKRCKQLTPENVDADPYFVGILIAMAQAHFYPTGAAFGRQTRSYPLPPKVLPTTFKDVTVRLLTCDNDAAEFIIYTATITSSLQERFQNPHLSCMPPLAGGNSAPHGIEIRYTRVPGWPVLGLKERLGRALGRDIVGDFDETKMELWEEPEGAPTGTLKRGRDDRGALAELFNGSFDGPAAEASSPGKRRRLDESEPRRVMVETRS